MAQALVHAASRLVPALAVLLHASAFPATLRFDLPGAEGVRHTQAELASKRAVVLVFVSAGCPLSARYVPELNRLHDEFSPQGVAFFAVQSNPFEKLEQARAYAREFSYRFPVLFDQELTLARQTGATVTPEAVVASSGGQILYRGRIDDRAIEIGRVRSAPTRQDLRAVLGEVVAGKIVRATESKAVGCAIPVPTSKRNDTSVTFNRHVAPILFRHCAGCHRPGQAAPFPLLSYRDAAPRASLIAHVTAKGLMPPWKPAPGPPHFDGERRLTTAEIATLDRWARAGASEGDTRDLASPPQFREGWQLGPPDAVIEMPEPFAVAPDGPDVYRCFVLPSPVDGDRYVRAFEFRPGSRRAVHHALVFADRSGTARKRDAAEPGPGYNCFGVPGFLPSASFGGWAPGTSARGFPEGVSVSLQKGADIVVQIHYHPTGKPEADRSAVALYFSAQPPTRRLMDVALGSRQIDIPPGDANYRVKDHFTLPVSVGAVGIIPHAHYICREMRAAAILPSGKRQTLLTITGWDFNWQEQYRYREPILLPAGTRVEMEFIYDNSDRNPRNPSAPPRRVGWGGDSTDEMAGLHLQVIPTRAQDAEELGQALWGKFMRSVGGGFFR
ncbi:MAG: redoxin domain-containing protein [Bryobacteraceae bacterium]